MESHRTKWLELLRKAPSRNAGRYAPSPTGTLHIGNLQSAYAAFLQAQQAQHIFILRIEDVDLGRVVEGSKEEIIRDLKRIGITWDEGPDCGGPRGPYLQSKRRDIYESALDFLKEKNLIYPCYCSRKDIRAIAKASEKGVIVYPGTCKNLSEEERKKKTTIPALRFNSPNKVIHHQDKICKAFNQNVKKEVGDFVLKRKDGFYGYQLAVVVDDILMGVRDVVRGEDLIDSTPRQIALYEALEATPPNFWHVPLLHDENGKKLSKRDASTGLDHFIATSDSKDPIHTLQQYFMKNIDGFFSE